MGKGWRRVLICEKWSESFAEKFEHRPKENENVIFGDTKGQSRAFKGEEASVVGVK
jgi:hypothetical protein